MRRTTSGGPDGALPRAQMGGHLRGLSGARDGDGRRVPSPPQGL
jgi:hypothetical protein